MVYLILKQPGWRKNPRAVLRHLQVRSTQGDHRQGEDMNVEKCRTFLEAAESGSFTAAGEKLYMTTANVTKHIASLEKELGYPLFERKTHGVKLTKEGKECVPFARQIVQAGDAMYGLGRDNTLKVFSIPCQQKIELPKLVSEFTAVCPGVRVEIEEYHGLKLLEKLLADECELGFIGNRYSDRDELETVQIFGERICAVLPAGHRYAKEKQISLRQLKDEDFVFLCPESGMYQVYEKLCQRCGFEPRTRMYASQDETVLSYIANGMGIALCGRSLVNAFQIQGVVLVELEEPFYSGCVLARKKNRKLSANAAVFWRFVKEKYGDG